MDLIAALAKEVNFTFLFQINDGYGKYNAHTKEWDGLIREILTGVRILISFYLIEIEFIFCLEGTTSYL